MTSDERSAAATAAKSQLRMAVRGRMAAMTSAEREQADSAICRHLSDFVRRRGFAFVVAYLALPDEARLDAFLGQLDGQGVPVLVPRVAVRGQVGLSVWTPGCCLTADLEGVPSPEEPAEWPGEQGLVVVPGRVFDTEGGRVGRGLGYYDRFLAWAGSKSVLAGAAYECQVVERVPREPHDVAVDWIVTETAMRRVQRK